MSMTYVLQDQRAQALPLEMSITGRDRHLYFRRPVAPIIQTQPPQMEIVPMEQQQEQFIETVGSATGPQQQMYQQQYQQQQISFKQTVAVQTIYRESEAQTNPYTPDFQIKQGETPEVLAITHFTYGNGLPASMAEMELIE